MDTRQAEIVDKIHFAVMAIEASAKEMRIFPMEMRRRLERVSLVRRLLSSMICVLVLCCMIASMDFI